MTRIAVQHDDETTILKIFTITYSLLPELVDFGKDYPHLAKPFNQTSLALKLANDKSISVSYAIHKAKSLLSEHLIIFDEVDRKELEEVIMRATAYLKHSA